MACCCDLASYEKLEKKCVLCLHCGKHLLQVTHTHTLPRHFSLSLAVSLSLSRRAADEEGAGGGKRKQRDQNGGQLCLKSFSAVLPISVCCFGRHKHIHSHSHDAVVTQGSRQCEFAAGLTWENTTNWFSQNSLDTYSQICGVKDFKIYCLCE